MHSGNGEPQQAGSLGLGVFRHKNVGASNSEQNSSCLETWDRLGEEAGTRRTYRRSSLSQHPAELALPKAWAPAEPRDPPGQCPGTPRGQAGQGGSHPAQPGHSSQAAPCSRCSTRSVQQPLWEGAQAGAEPGRLPAALLPQPPAASPPPQQAAPGPGDTEVPSAGPALTPACTAPSGRSVSAPSSWPLRGKGAQL